MSGLRDEVERPAADVPPEFDERGRLRLRRRSRNRRIRRGLLVLSALVVLAALYSVTQLFLARGELFAARAELAQGAGALPAGNAEEALQSFDIARRSAQGAEARLSGPILRATGAIPGAGRTVRTSHAVAASAALVARAGQEVSAAAIGLPDGISALAPQDGRIPVQSIAAVAPALDTAQRLLREAQQEIAASPATGLPRAVSDARTDLLTQLDVVAPQLETAAAVSAALPAFLGEDGPRRYFFGAQNPAELRGTGGFIGAYTVLKIDDGELDFGSFQSIVDLSPLPVGGVEPPSAEYDRLYRFAGGAGFGQNANMTADVPSAAIALQRLYERIEGEELDGAVFADPHAFAALLEVAGPVAIDDVGEVTSETVVDQIANEAYALLPDSDARKELLGAVASATLTRFLQQGASEDPVRAAEALVDITGGGHLRLHAEDPAVMDAFDVAGVTGRLDSPHDLLAVVGNNIAQNKVDFYTDRHVTHEVWLEQGGSATVETAVHLRNEAPVAGQPLDVIGPNVDMLEAGENHTMVTVYCGPGCTHLETHRDGENVEPTLEGTELGYRLVATNERYRSGEEAVVTHRLRVPDAWDASSGRYRLRVLDQPTIRPTTLDLSIHSPEGMLVADAGPRMAVSDRTATWSGELDGAMDLEARLGPPARSEWERFVDFLREPIFTIGG